MTAACTAAHRQPRQREDTGAQFPDYARSGLSHRFKLCPFPNGLDFRNATVEPPNYHVLLAPLERVRSRWRRRELALPAAGAYIPTAYAAKAARDAEVPISRSLGTERLYLRVAVADDAPAVHAAVIASWTELSRVLDWAQGHSPLSKRPSRGSTTGSPASKIVPN